VPRTRPSHVTVTDVEYNEYGQETAFWLESRTWTYVYRRANSSEVPVDYFLA
jgi:hypothetical protein